MITTTTIPSSYARALWRQQVQRDRRARNPRQHARIRASMVYGYVLESVTALGVPQWNRYGAPGGVLIRIVCGGPYGACARTAERLGYRRHRLRDRIDQLRMWWHAGRYVS